MNENFNLIKEILLNQEISEIRDQDQELNQKISHYLDLRSELEFGSIKTFQESQLLNSKAIILI